MKKKRETSQTQTQLGKHVHPHFSTQVRERAGGMDRPVTAVLENAPAGPPLVLKPSSVCMGDPQPCRTCCRPGSSLHRPVAGVGQAGKTDKAWLVGVVVAKSSSSMVLLSDEAMC